jgi:hypothetical protein
MKDIMPIAIPSVLPAFDTLRENLLVHDFKPYGIFDSLGTPDLHKCISNEQPHAIAWAHVCLGKVILPSALFGKHQSVTIPEHISDAKHATKRDL